MIDSQRTGVNHDLEIEDANDLNYWREKFLRLLLINGSENELKKKWDALAENYDKNVYSITKFPKKRERIINSIHPGEKVLIAGCGSASYLQRDLLTIHPQTVEIIASDFSPEMVKFSQSAFFHPHLKHVLLDTRKLGYENKMDKVISTNSIVPSSRKEILAMYDSIYQALKSGGEFIGYFPSFSSLLKMAEERPELREIYRDMVDYEEYRFNDTVGWQSWQTKEKLLDELTQAGFYKDQITIEAIGCESKLEGEELAQIYRMDEEFISRHFECFFVKAKK